MSPVLKCPECGSFIQPGQERCDHCGIWFKNSTSPTLSTIMADNDRSNKPIETISYYGDAYVPGNSGIGVSVYGNVVLSPSTPGMIARVVKRVTGTVVEETSEYVIVMTRKNELVKIRPENVIKREPITPSSAEQKQRLRQGALRGIITGALFTFAGITFLTGSYLRGSSPALLLGAGMAVFGLVLLLMMWGVYSKNQSSSQ